MGIAGLVGAGRTELLRMDLFESSRPYCKIEICGELLALDNPRTAIKAGIALAPEDRKQHGLVLPMSVRENTSFWSASRERQPVDG